MKLNSKGAIIGLGLVVALAAIYYWQDRGTTTTTTTAAAGCGDKPVSVASMNWQSAEVLAQIDKFILEAGYDCNVEIVPGDTMPTMSSMTEKSEPDVAPEMWINAVREPIDKAVAEGRLAYAGKSLTEGGIEGFWIPKYIADANPEIKTLDDALKRPDLFPSPEDPEKGGMYNCPSGWNCQILTGNAFKAWDAENKGFVLVDPGSAAGLDGSIAKAFARKQGWLGYYWAPTSVLGKYPMVKLDLGVEHDSKAWTSCNTQPDCLDPQKNEWPTSDVYTIVTERFKKAGGDAAQYLSNRGWDNATVGELLAWMTDNQATGEDSAVHFLKNYPQVWEAWVSPQAATKVKAAL